MKNIYVFRTEKTNYFVAAHSEGGAKNRMQKYASRKLQNCLPEYVGESPLPSEKQSIPCKVYSPSARNLKNVLIIPT